MRFKSGLYIGIFGLIVVLLGGWFFTLATALLTYFALLEFFRMAEFKGIKPATKTTLVSSFVIIIFTYLETRGLIEGEISNSILPICAVVICTWLLLQPKPGTISDIAASIFGLFYLGFLPSYWIKLLLNSKKFNTFKVLQSPFKLVQSPEIEIGIAWRSETRSIPFSKSLNKISGDIICPYPPGIPLLVPGEKIDIDRFNWINNQSLCNKDLLNFNIRVIKT